MLATFVRFFVSRAALQCTAGDSGPPRTPLRARPPRTHRLKRLAIPDPAEFFALLECESLPPLSRYNCILDVINSDPVLNRTACLSGAPAFPLSDNATCPLGYTCPAMNVSDENTFPQLCPATEECFAQRLGSQWCERQGPFEPLLCVPGQYCPNASVSLECPEGYWCVRGTSSPRPNASAAHESCRIERT